MRRRAGPGPEGPRACRGPCGRVLPAEEFYWKAPGVRRDPLCRACRKEYQAELDRLRAARRRRGEVA